ncbi:MAG: carboxylating nicotinate-nucleotide diphosphorylase, partial [Candidatus Thermoplasmatota archaeon]|nr:carboxylating nicotinate-nucleotide diphosphorylase [Candidatus Thermoplasmatota archaeon]
MSDEDIQTYNEKKVQIIVERALKEDIGTGDITTENLISEDSRATADIRMKEEGVIAGVDIAGMVFLTLDDDIKYMRSVEDGERLDEGDKIAQVKGPTKAILEGERVALNFLQRLSGIATNTREYVDKVEDYPATVVDTRKTTPGLRILEKYAVRVGGGFNHRMGLYDAVLIKDNHMAAGEGITGAIKSIKE